ncbi:hypothetical protein MTO96_025102 [Rhipicephalus appendiculatus]
MHSCGFPHEGPDAGPGSATPLFTAASLAQSRFSAVPASGPQPDRLSPQSKSFSQGYGSVLRTSLPTLGRQKRTGQRKSRTALRSHRPYLGVNPFQGLDLLTEKTLPGAPIGVPELVCVATLGPEGPISVAGFGIVNPIPFWLQRGVSISQTELHKRARF